MGGGGLQNLDIVRADTGGVGDSDTEKGGGRGRRRPFFASYLFSCFIGAEDIGRLADGGGAADVFEGTLEAVENIAKFLIRDDLRLVGIDFSIEAVDGNPPGLDDGIDGADEIDAGSKA